MSIIATTNSSEFVLTPAQAESAIVSVPVNQEDELRPELEEFDVSPGLVGFLVTFGVAAALIVLLISMTKRLRKVKHAEGANQRVTATFDGAGPRLKSHESAAPAADGSGANATDGSTATAATAAQGASEESQQNAAQDTSTAE